MFLATDFVCGATDAEYAVYIGRRSTNCGDGCCSSAFVTGSLWKIEDKTEILSDEMEGDSISAEVAQMMVTRGRLRGFDIRKDNTAFYVDDDYPWLVDDLLTFPPDF